MMLRHLIAKLRGGAGDSRNFALLLGGGVAASAIPLVVSPLLTRIYTPAEMGAASIVSTIIGVASTVLTGRYEIPAGFLSKDQEAADLTWVAMAVTGLLAGGVVLGMLVFPIPIRDLLRYDLIGQWIWLLPVGLLCQGILQTTTLWLNRKSLFGEIVVAKISRSLANAAFGVGLGGLGLGSAGLIAGTVGGLGVAASFSLWKMCGNQRSAGIAFPDGVVIGAAIRRFSEYPLYNASSSLLDSLSFAVPVFFLVHYFTPTDAGAYGLCVMVFGAPAAVVMEAVTQTSLNTVVAVLRSGGRAAGLVAGRMSWLAVLVAVVLIPLTCFAPEIFSACFGANWHKAGQMAQIVGWVFGIRLVVSPFVFVLNVAGWNRSLAIWKCCYFALMVSVLACASNWDVMSFLGSFLAVELLSYIACLMLIFRATAGRRLDSAGSEESNRGNRAAN